MNYGYVKVAASVPRVRVADCKFNAGQIEKEIIIADGKGVQIIAFPELCITGYTCPITKSSTNSAGLLPHFN